MNIITSKPIIVAGRQNDDYSNLNGDSPKDDIVAFQNWAVSKGYIPNDKANGKWNLNTDMAYDNYGKLYESQKGGGFRFDLFPNQASIKASNEPVKTSYPTLEGAVLPTLNATAVRPKPTEKSNKKWLWIGLGVLVVGLSIYANKKSKK